MAESLCYKSKAGCERSEIIVVFDPRKLRTGLEDADRFQTIVEHGDMLSNSSGIQS